MRVVIIVPVALAAFLACACGPEPAWFGLDGRDIKPPLVLRVEAASADVIEMEFSEPVTMEPSDAVGEGLVKILKTDAEGHILRVTTDSVLPPGVECRFFFRVKDSEGNSLSFSAGVSGFNPSIPRLLISEVRTDGSGAKTDLIELRAMTAGDMVGVTVMTGIPGKADGAYRFGTMKVEEGDYIVVHAKRLAAPGEVSETDDKAAATAVDCHPQAWDVYCDTPMPLSKNNGCLGLYRTKHGGLIDAFLYSNRENGSETKYGGFGSASFQERAVSIGESGGWKGEGEELTPEDCASSAEITAARSFRRNPGYEDTDTKEDWNIAPAGKTTFGFANTADCL